MRKISRKLLLSTLTVVLTVIALGTTTFAWFTITNTAKVQSFETQIAADEGIEIAIGIINPAVVTETKYEVRQAANLNWVTTLSSTDIEEFIDLHLPSAFRFEHLTSPDGRTFYTFAQDAVGGSVAINDGYLELPIHFRSANVNTINWKSVQLNDDSPAWTSDVDSFTNFNGTVVNRGSSITVNPTDAIRIAVDNGSSVVVYEKPGSATNHELGTGGDLTATVDPDGVSGNEDDYKVSERGAHSYYFAKTNLLPDGIAAVTTVATTTNLTELDAEGTAIMTLPAGNQATAGMDYYGEININIWIEGWDANAFNSILDEFIRISFEFKGVIV